MNTSNIHTRGIPTDSLEHPGRKTLLEYVNQHMDSSQYFISESASGERGVLTYTLSLNKGTYSGGIMSYSLFDSIHLVRETARVSRATAKALHTHVQSVYDTADSRIALLEAQSAQWKAQKRTPGQVRYYSNTYELYVGAGYLVTVNLTTKEHSISKVSETYKPNELGAPQGDVFSGYKYQEYHEDINLRDIFDKYKATPTEELDRMIQEREEREAQAERNRVAAFKLEQEEKRKKQEEARATLADRKPFLLVKYVHEDDSDIQTDYFSNRLAYCEILGEYDTPIRTTFAGGRMDIWRKLRELGEHIDGLKWKTYGGLMGLKNSDYTGHGGYIEVKYLTRDQAEKDSYLISALSRASETVAA